MKLLFLNYEYPPLGGGAATATEAILKEFAKIPGLEVHLVTAATGSALEHERLGGEVYIHRLPIGKNPENLHVQSQKDLLIYAWKSYFFLRSFMKQERIPFEAILAFFTVPCGFIAYLLAQQFRIPYIVSLRGSDVPGYSDKFKSIYFILAPIIRFVWKRAHAVLPNSIGLRELALRASPKQRMQIIENGVDTEVFSPKPELRSGESLVFVSTSRLTERKGIDTLLRAFAYVMEHRPVEKKTELWLLGGGEDQKKLEALAKELGIEADVKFFGRIAHDAIPAFYQKAHVFVLPSKNEGMSNSALEAMASGLPLVVSGTGGMQELVENGKNGFFIEPTRTAEFGQVLLRFLENPVLSQELGNTSRQKALEKSWEKVAKRFLETFSSGQL